MFTGEASGWSWLISGGPIGLAGPAGLARGVIRLLQFQWLEIRGSCRCCRGGQVSLDSDLGVFSQLLRQGVAILGGQFGEVYVGVVNAQVLTLVQEPFVASWVSSVLQEWDREGDVNTGPCTRPLICGIYCGGDETLGQEAQTRQSARIREQIACFFFHNKISRRLVCRDGSGPPHG